MTVTERPAAAPERGYSATKDQVAIGLLDQHARRCLANADSAKQADMTDEILAAVARLMRRG